MIKVLRKLFHRKRVRNDALLGQRSHDYRMQNAQFVSFLQQSGFRHRQLNRHDKSKLFKRFIAVAFGWAIAIGFIWVVIESAQALELF